MDQRWFTSAAEAEAYVDGLDPQEWDIYFGVSPRLEGQADKRVVSTLRALWADVDFKHFRTEAEARTVLEGFELPPSLVVHSGGGLQAYWLFESPYDATPANIAHAESLMLRLYQRLGGLDKVQDVSRIMRVPGTRNQKYADKPLVIQVPELGNRANTYTLDQFESVLPMLPTWEADSTGGEAGTNALTVEQVRDALSHLPPHGWEYNSEYLPIMMAVARNFPDDPDRATWLLQEWSPAMDPQGNDITAQKVRSFAGNGGALRHRRSHLAVGLASRIIAPDAGWSRAEGEDVRSRMSFQAKRELLAQIAGRYQAARPVQKTQILDEFVAATGYTRKYAIRVLRHPPPVAAAIRRPRAPRYGQEVQAALRVAWEAANGICGKRLVPFLPELVPALERHGHLQLTDEIRVQLLTLSAATADRLLASARRAVGPRGIATTKPGALLKQQVPLRTFAGWDDAAPGFVEADLVAHCGPQPAGAFLHTLVLTDVATGWTECLPLLTRSHDAVIGALGQARRLLPFPLLGLDTDNGPEFLNYELLGYCERERITFTRGRAYRKNDQCFVEQKNGVVVRQLVGYDRFEGADAYRQLGEVYRALRLYVNFFQPSMKLQEKRRDGTALHRRYDRAQTPWQRLLASGVLAEDATARLTSIFHALDPVRLRRQLEALLDALWRHASFATPVNPAGAHLAASPGPLVAFQHAACGIPEDAPLGCTATGRRRYRQSHKYAGPRWWRTRADPFADVWEDVKVRLAADPTRTAKGLFRDLQAEHPGRYPDIQLRTLQRRVQQWRATAILTFQDIWHDDDRLASAPLVAAAD